jgi:general stress protein 26
MDSINKNQPEKNHADLSGKDAVEKIRQLAKGAETCFFTTCGAAGPSAGTRPMSVREVDDEGNLWFLSSIDSFKNRELAQDPSASLYFQGAAHAEFLHLQGSATISQDKAAIKRLWSFLLKTWFTEGEDDHRITVIKFTPSHAYYWDNKHGKAVAGAKMLVGAVVGTTLDDSIEGRLTISH